MPRVASPKPGPVGAGSGADVATAPSSAHAGDTIALPLDVYLVNLQIFEETIEPYEVRVGRETRTQKRKVRKIVKTVASGQSAEGVQEGLDRVNAIWKPAGISFQMSSVSTKSLEFDSDVVTEQGFLLLVTALKLPKTGLSVMFVGKFDSPHLGGQAVDSLGAGIVTKLKNPTLGNVLAHELGHLLGLPDLKHVAGSVKSNYNLMYEALSAGQTLTDDQIRTARDRARIKAKR